MKVMAALALLAACHADAFIPDGTVRITPPPEYRQWWEASRACVDKIEWRTFDEIRWFVSPEPLLSGDGVSAAALTIDNRVYIQAVYASVPWVIQHELVHAINGIHGHPADPFLKCNLMVWH